MALLFALVPLFLGAAPARAASSVAIGGFTLVKRVSGSPGASETFRFELRGADPSTPMPSGSTGNVKQVSQSGAGEQSLGQISYDAAGTYRYTLREIAGTAPGYSYDSTVYNITVYVNAPGSGLAATVVYEKQGSPGVKELHLLFQNAYSSPTPIPSASPTPTPLPGTGALTLTKTVTGSQGELNREFHFTVYLFGAAGSYPYSGSKSGTLASGGVIALKHGESVTITGLPVGTSYSVTEAEANQEGYLSTASGAGAIIVAGGSTAAFVNQRGATALPTATPTFSFAPTATPSGGGSGGSGGGGGGSGGSSTPPKTGDAFPPLFGALGLALPLMLILVLTRRRKAPPRA
ncbi:MAG: DUF5979 domain-containing protein [Christensenellaceae bacterium]|nr:DUF5979 domain-containing protein [Christensenellaceae bacterium]